jgi:hypothetical protein
MTADAMIELKKNLLWDSVQAQEKFFHTRESVIQLSSIVEDLQKWLTSSIDPLSQAEHKKLTEIIGLKARTYEQIFELAKNAINDVMKYKELTASLTKRKSDLGME